MPKRSLLHRCVPLLTAYLLVAAVGMPLHHAYCACAGEEILSLAGMTHDCTHPVGELTAAPAETGHACCSARATPAAAQAHKSCSNCGDGEILILGVDVESGVSTYAALDAPATSASPSTQANCELPSRLLSRRAHPIRGPSPPPRPGGRALLICLGTFLI